MNQKHIAVGIDVGSTKVATTIGQATEHGVDIIGVGFAPSTGVRKGVVTDIEETVSSIAASLEEAERMSGIPVTEAVINIGGVQMQTTSSKGVIAIARQDGEISENDVVRVLDSAKAVSVPANREILHMIPRNFVVDGHEGVKDPIGMSGIRLEVEAQVISSAAAAVKNLTKCLSQGGVEVTDLVFTPLATAKSVLSKRQKEIGVCLIDIGGATTTFSVFEEGDVLHAGVLPVGASHITNDIAIGMRTSIDTAELLKIKYGVALPDQVDEDEEIDLHKLDPNESGTANRHYVAQIIEARMNEILVMVRDELRKIGRDGMLPAGLVLTGGGAKQTGIIDLTKQTMRLPAQVGQVTHSLAGMVDNIQDPLYAASIGLMLWGLEAPNPQRRSNSGKGISNQLGSAYSKASGFIKHLFP